MAQSIEAAIARAREQRGAGPGGAAGRSPGARTPRIPLEVVEANWAAVAEASLSPRRLARRHIVSLEGGARSAPFDLLRTKVLQQMRANGWKRVAVTSPTAGCGKSTLCLNLAFSLSRQPEIRTMLLEMDLRRPSMATTIGLKPHSDFSSVLAGRAELVESAVRHGSNLVMALNRKPFFAPSELIQSSATTDRLAEIEARFAPDVMIFDTPPLLMADDSFAFLAHVDCVLLVAAAEETTVREIDQCERDVAAQTNVLGVVLNKCRAPAAGQGYGYGYGGYGYS